MNIGGKERELKIGLNQSILYCDLRGISISEMNSDLGKLATGTGAELRDLIWSALKDGARKSKTEFPYTNYDVGDWIEELKDEELTKFLADLVGSMPKSNGKVKKKVKKA